MSGCQDEAGSEETCSPVLLLEGILSHMNMSLQFKILLGCLKGQKAEVSFSSQTDCIAVFLFLLLIKCLNVEQNQD